MEQLNKKGFFSVSIIYSFLILFILLMLGIVSSYVVRDTLIGSVVKKAQENLAGETATVLNYAETLKLNTPPTNTTVTAPGRVAATTNEGLIIGPNDDYGDTTYYYRGAVTNNYVSFAGLTWRIIRINGDGTIRMILDDYIDTTGSEWNTNNSSKVYATAISYVTYSNSTIKTTLENWYDENIGSNTTYSDKVAISKFCSDKSHTWTAASTSNQMFAPYNRIYPNGAVTNAAPIMTCPNSSDIYNLNVGLITIDEMSFAGGGINLPNTNYYLYNSNLTTPAYWRTMTPCYWNGDGTLRAHVVSATNGSSNWGYLNTLFGVRPVISLNTDVEITTESPTNPGTSSNPYVIDN